MIVHSDEARTTTSYISLEYTFGGLALVLLAVKKTTGRKLDLFKSGFVQCFMFQIKYSNGVTEDRVIFSGVDVERSGQRASTHHNSQRRLQELIEQLDTSHMVDLFSIVTTETGSVLCLHTMN